MKKNLILFGHTIAFFLFAISAFSQTNNVKNFGAPFQADHTITYEELTLKMQGVDSLPAQVSGTVKAVCQKKGCWMTLTAEGKPDMRVTFKDYAFFMPKDLSGHQVIVDGYAYIETTPVNILKHYAEDAGKTKEEIDAIKEPLRELSFEAAGVKIVK
ncbi:MAG: DUF4920 domain-containing protein [Bacteroidetes bacterium]|nr:DUF4920 domain-containing protein [Bacteroidota bacterium]